MVDHLSDTTRSRLYRILYIDNTIKSGRYPNSRSLAANLKVSPRTILRDVEFMKDRFKAPLEYCPQTRGFYYTGAGYSIGLLKLLFSQVKRWILSFGAEDKVLEPPGLDSEAAREFALAREL